MLLFSNEASYILHRRPYREQQLLLDVLCRKHGLIRAIATFKRRDRSGAFFEPLCLLSLEGQRRSGELFKVRQNDSALPPKLTFTEIMLMQHIHEILLSMLPRETPIAELFERYTLLLNQPNAVELRHFEFFLFNEFGLLPEWPCAMRDADYFQLNAEEGVLRFSAAKQGFPAQEVAAFFKQDITPANAVALKNISRSILSYHQYHANKTRSTLQEWHGLLQARPIHSA